MTDDQFWRILIGGGVMGLMVHFRVRISAFMHRIGYRDWRKPPDPK